MKAYHGMDVLGESFSKRSPQIQLKAAVLLTDLLNTEVFPYICLKETIIHTHRGLRTIALTLAQDTKLGISNLYTIFITENWADHHY